MMSHITDASMNFIATLLGVLVAFGLEYWYKYHIETQRYKHALYNGKAVCNKIIYDASNNLETLHIYDMKMKNNEVCTEPITQYDLSYLSSMFNSYMHEFTSANSALVETYYSIVKVTDSFRHYQLMIQPLIDENLYYRQALHREQLFSVFDKMNALCERLVKDACILEEALTAIYHSQESLLQKCNRHLVVHKRRTPTD
ncbi:MAG: hypothetical protein ACYC1M_18395 [Armatimonadota bacterium]